MKSQDPSSRILRIICVNGGRYAEWITGSGLGLTVLDTRPTWNRYAREILLSHCEAEKRRAREITLRAMKLKADLIAHS